jgi:hypothetical protein
VPTAAREREAMLVSAVSAVVVTLAGVLWVECLLGVLESVPAREWLQSPIQSLAAAMVLGLALLQRSVSASRMSLAPPSWAPAVAGIGSGLLVLLLWRELVIREEMQLAARSQIASDAVQRAIERQVSVIQASIDRVARFVRVAPTSLATLQSTVPPLVAETDGLGRMLLLDSTGLLRRVIPGPPCGRRQQAALTRVRGPRLDSADPGLDGSQWSDWVIRRKLRSFIRWAPMEVMSRGERAAGRTRSAGEFHRTPAPAVVRPYWRFTTRRRTDGNGHGVPRPRA